MTDGAASIHCVHMCVFVFKVLCVVFSFPTKQVCSEGNDLSNALQRPVILCVPMCVLSRAVHLNVFACVCTSYSVCRMLGHITVLPF